MEKNKKLLVVALVLTLVLIFGTTYAWLRITKESNVVNKIKAGNLELTLDDKASEGIKLLKAVPMSYQQGIKTEEYTFTLTNTSSTSSYTLSLKDLTTYTNDNDEEVTIADADRLGDSKVRYILLKDGEKSTASKSKILTDRVIDSGTIEKGQTIKYSLRIWIDSTAGDDNKEAEVMGKIFNAQLSLDATQPVTPTKTAVCKRATTLHTEQCMSTAYSSYCGADGYRLDDSNQSKTVTYGSLGIKGVLTTGDAFDCDVNGDGVYDSVTERFYYVTDVDSETAALILYNDVASGIPLTSEEQTNRNAPSYAEEKLIGPTTAIKQLPTTEQWKNVALSNTSRDIKDETGTVVVSNFSYSGYAARLLTTQELDSACKVNVGSYGTAGLVSKCNFILENTNYTDTGSKKKNYGFWLENYVSSDTSSIWITNGYYRDIDKSLYSDGMNYETRPVIEVAKSSIEY